MTVSTRPVKLLIADDHEIVRQGFHTMLARNSNIRIVGEAADGKDLVRLAKETKPDVIITDIRMPNLSGVEATIQITRDMPAVGIIAFTMIEDDEQIIDMLEAGAQGYLMKNSSKIEILEAIRTVRDGKSYYCSSTSRKMAGMIARSRHQPSHENTHGFKDRELEIIRLICEGFSNKEIAAKLEMSLRTVEGTRERILDKMDTHNTAGIVVFAIREGLYKV